MNPHHPGNITNRVSGHFFQKMLFLSEEFTKTGFMSTAVRESPRISINKLSEYIVASPVRRKKIIQDQKYPPSYKAPYYKAAEDAIVEFFTNHLSDELISDRALSISEQVSETDWQENRRNACLEAIEKFMDYSDELDFGELTFKVGEPSPNKLMVANVQISVRPEVYLVDSSQNVQGCIKLVFSKGRTLSQEEASYTGSCLSSWMHNQFQSTDYRKCFLLDIFGQAHYQAPKSHKRRMRDVEAACEEIFYAWSRI